MKKLLSSTAAAAVAILVSAGCSTGGGGGSSNAVTGTINGTKLNVKSAIYMPTATLGTSGTTITYGFLSDDPNACDNLGAGTISGGSTFMELLFANVTTVISAPTTPGAFPVVSESQQLTANEGNIVLGDVVQQDASCNCTDCTTGANGPVAPDMESGTIQVTKMSGGFVGHGSGISLATGDAVGVTFNFKECPALENLFVSGALSCGAPITP